MRSRILIVARDVALRAGLARLLRGGGHSIELAENAAHARRLGADLKSVDLVLLALEGLGHEGNTLAAELQATSKPLLLLGSAASTSLPELKRVVVDPADEGTLLARVAEALRRQRASPEAAEAAPLLCFAGYRLDLAGHGLTNASGAEIPLTRGEFRLLREFAQRPGRVLSRGHLLGVLAGREAETFDRSVDMLISRLRRKIEPDPKRPSLIATVPGSGYKLATRVTHAEPPSPSAIDSAPPADPSADVLGSPHFNASSEEGTAARPKGELPGSPRAGAAAAMSGDQTGTLSDKTAGRDAGEAPVADRAAALLEALRAATSLGDGRLGPSQVEVLARAHGVEEDELPALVARWSRAGQVAISWGGTLGVVPKAAAGANSAIGASGTGSGAPGH